MSSENRDVPDKKGRSREARRTIFYIFDTFQCTIHAREARMSGERNGTMNSAVKDGLEVGDKMVLAVEPRGRAVIGGKSGELWWL